MKSTIGGRKPAAKKPGGLGGKKGLGATKVTKNFSEIERDAEMADSIAGSKREEAKAEAVLSEEAAAAQLANMRLAYQDITVQQEKQKDRLAKIDPKKAEQMERLGMGFSSGAGLGGLQSHSLRMGEIVEKDEVTSGWSRGGSRLDEICAPSNSNKSAWEQDLNENVAKSAKKPSAWDNDFDTKPKRTPAPVSTGGPAGEEAVKN